MQQDGYKIYPVIKGASFSFSGHYADNSEDILAPVSDQIKDTIEKFPKPFENADQVIVVYISDGRVQATNLFNIKKIETVVVEAAE